MAWRIGLVPLLLLCASAVGAHESVGLDARRASPGLHLELTELPPTTTRASATPKYRLKASGMPDGVVFGVWAKDFGHSFRQVATGFYRDESGVLVSSARDSAGQQTRLDEMALEPGPYPRGATWEVALASADRTLTAFAKVIPRPIAAQDGRCTVSLELASRRGDRFVASGAGFAPDEEVTAESRYSGRVIQKKLRVSADGRLLPELISHAASETDHTARYLLKGRSCEVTVDYEWGEPALMPR